MLRLPPSQRLHGLVGWYAAFLGLFKGTTIKPSKTSVSRREFELQRIVTLGYYSTVGSDAEPVVSCDCYAGWSLRVCSEVVFR